MAEKDISRKAVERTVDVARAAIKDLLENTIPLGPSRAVYSPKELKQHLSTADPETAQRIIQNLTPEQLRTLL